MRAGRDIDKLFKEGLGSPNIPFNDLDWEDLEQKLHPNTKRRMAPIWFAAVAGVAAMIIVVFFIMRNDDDHGKQKLVVEVKGKKTADREKINPSNPKDSGGQANDSVKNTSIAEKQNLAPFGVEGISNLNPQPAFGKDFNKTLNEDELALSTEIKSGSSLASLSYNSILLSSVNPVQFKNQVLVTNIKRTRIDKAFDPVSKTKPRLVLSILAAPDLTSVQASGKSNLSASLGAELTLFLTKRLSITSGAGYAKKIYDSDFSLYRPNSSYVFKENPTNVHANCDVIDVPLNVNYKVFDNNRNSITVSTGLSSYLMLKEKYSYTYADEYQKPLDYEVKNQNQHYLGIANVGIEFQHKINNNLSISARPFMKIPLTDIGYGNSKLSSTGLAVSLNINLFKKN
ncbi:hypothetical protein DHW03_08205 [Pedobacter yonginense]|uniref:Outer membrane protein beta-barrel domain-containing protein n=1 Tax=Pedobacter yonginense TaxID=651869 RepID=A0A317ENT5_9SPHI|nr:hypothetical protein [Pedobacter yonginense]PWS27563.1 hypothetical protein DHW03_08205 [Pedobacter yonginense]